MLKARNIEYDAVILDMDGVITDTATVHAKAWKMMFDDLLQEMHGDKFIPLDIEDDYYKYIDGKPRLDGIRSFLLSRNIVIPEGDPDDEPEVYTVFALGERKNKAFFDILEEEGVEVFNDTLEMLKFWNRQNIKLAVISSSRNCEYIIEKAGLTPMFEVRVDGVVLEEKQLKGKPEPDMFLQAAKELGADISRTIIVEDAVSGIEAGKKGEFALVVAVNRHGAKKEKLLSEAGADLVLKNLTEIKEL